MEQYDFLIEVLEQSIKKNGSKPLTTQYLLNILKFTQREIDKEEKRLDQGVFDSFWDND